MKQFFNRDPDTFLDLFTPYLMSRDTALSRTYSPEDESTMIRSYEACYGITLPEDIRTHISAMVRFMNIDA